MAVNEKIRVRLKSYDHTLIDTAAEKIVTVAKANGSEVFEVELISKLLCN